MTGLSELRSPAAGLGELRSPAARCADGRWPRLRVRALAAEAGLDDAVRFTGSRSDVPEILALTDVLLLTSDIETSPLCVLEAMSCGVPVVATAVGGVQEVVAQGVTGFTASPDDEAALADAVTALLRDRERATILANAARERVLSSYTLERTVEGYARLLAELRR